MVCSPCSVIAKQKLTKEYTIFSRVPETKNAAPLWNEAALKRNFAESFGKIIAEFPIGQFH
ncbi:MAG: hypothetical protein EAZ92_01765 [Candidatus Kapaibacterium sp.]|nr:MAG: hypothetical protein EAZ92_01765 [Candidatus Kapabacteria bacterium]